MKTTKRIISLVLCFIMMLGGYTTVYAQVENVGVTNSPIYLDNNNGISIYSTSIPTTVWNLKKDGKYSFGGHTESETLYTNVLLTGASKVRIIVYNRSDKYNVKYQLKKKVTGINPVISTNYTAKGNGLKSSAEVSIDSNSKYYIRFPATCDFYGSIEAI